MSHGNGKDQAAARAELVKRLSQLPAKQRLDALIAQDDAAAAVQAVPAQELYRTIAEVGLADATELVQLAAPAQFRAMVDLGAWKKDELDEHALLTWLRAAHGDDEADFLAKLDGLDLEVVELLLRRLVVIHDLEEDPDVNPAGVTMESPEGKYLLELKAEGAELAGIRALLSSIIARDPFTAGRLFEAVRWEIDTELAEEAYRFRSARLQELGFPELYDALGLFSWADPDKAAAELRAAPPSAAGLAPAGVDRDYPAQALAQLGPAEREAAEEELRYVVNQALVAEGADPGDLAALRRVAELAHDYLSLGLEHLSGGDPARAGEVLRGLPLRRVFQVGFSLTLKLKFRVDRLLKQPLTRVHDTWLLMPDEANVVSALNRKRPLKAVKVEGAEPMPFRARRELHEAALALDRAEAQLLVFRALLGGTPEGAAERLSRFDAKLPVLGADRLFASTVASALLDGRPEPRPVPAARFPELLAAVLGPAAEPRQRALEVLSASGPRPAVEAMVDQTLAAWREEWSKPYLATGGVDPRLVLAVPIEGIETL